MHARTQYTPLTVEEQQFAADNHYIVDGFLRGRNLPRDDWYDVVIFRYLLSVKKWFQRPELHQWKFSTIANNSMRSAVGNERERQKKEIKTVSLDSIIPGTEDIRLLDTVTEDNLKFVAYVEGEDMNISYDVIVPERTRRNVGQKSDEVIAIESFLTTKKMKNMRFEYDALDEAKKKQASVRTYLRKNDLTGTLDSFRVEQNVYVVRIEKKGSGK